MASFNFFVFSFVKLFLTSLLLTFSSVESIITLETERPSAHTSADFFKIVNLNPNKLNVIDERIRQVRSDIKKLDDKVNKLEKNDDVQKALIAQMSSKLIDMDGKLNQIITNTKPKPVSLNYPTLFDENPFYHQTHKNNKRIIANQRILVGRSISNDEMNHDEYTNQFDRNSDLNINEFKSINEFIQTVIGWQNRTDVKLTKIMNVIVEIYREDKQLSLDLSKLNERQTNEDKSDLVERMRKEFKEQFSINKAELKTYIGNVNENCLKTKTQNENLTFLLLGIKDDLSNPGLKTSGRSKSNQDNSVLPTEDENRVIDTSSLITKNEFVCRSSMNLINNTIEQFKSDLNNAKNQILNKIDKENAKINERIFTLNNNYQHLNNLRNCNSTVQRSIDSSNGINSIQNEIDSQSIRSPFKSTTKSSESSFEINSMTSTSTFIPPFYQMPSKRDDQESRSKSNTRTKLINPIRYGQMRRNCRLPNIVKPSNCEELYDDRVNCDGVYIVFFNEEAGRVYCEIDEYSGATIIMRRGQFNDYPVTLFNKNWHDYKKGFGNVDADFWLGLDKIHQLTRNRNQILEIDLESFNGEQMTLRFNQFYVDDEFNQYKLTIGEPDKENQNYANSFLQHNGALFKTSDREIRYNCARKFEAGWWYLDDNQCHTVLLNGALYNNSSRPVHKEGIQWPSRWPKQYLKAVQMKIKERK